MITYVVHPVQSGTDDTSVMPTHAAEVEAVANNTNPSAGKTIHYNVPESLFCCRTWPHSPIRRECAVNGFLIDDPITASAVSSPTMGGNSTDVKGLPPRPLNSDQLGASKVLHQSGMFASQEFSTATSRLFNQMKAEIQPILSSTWDGEDVTFLFHGAWLPGDNERSPSKKQLSQTLSGSKKGFHPAGLGSGEQLKSALSQEEFDLGTLEDSTDEDGEVKDTESEDNPAEELDCLRQVEVRVQFFESLVEYVASTIQAGAWERTVPKLYDVTVGATMLSVEGAHIVDGLGGSIINAANEKLKLGYLEKYHPELLRPEHKSSKKSRATGHSGNSPNKESPTNTPTGGRAGSRRMSRSTSISAAAQDIKVPKDVLFKVTEGNTMGEEGSGESPSFDGGHGITRRLHVAELVRGTGNYGVKQVSVMPMLRSPINSAAASSKTDVKNNERMKLRQRVITASGKTVSAQPTPPSPMILFSQAIREWSQNPAQSLILAFHIKQSCTIASAKSSRVQIVLWNRNTPIDSTVTSANSSTNVSRRVSKALAQDRSKNVFGVSSGNGIDPKVGLDSELLQCLTKHQRPEKIDFVDMQRGRGGGWMQQPINQLLLSAIHKGKELSHVALFERVDVCHPQESLRVMAAAKDVAPRTILDQATRDVVKVTNRFVKNRDHYGTQVTVLAEEVKEQLETLRRQEHTIGELTNASAMGGVFRQIKSDAARNAGMGTAGNILSPKQGGGAFQDDRFSDEDSDDKSNKTGDGAMSQIVALEEERMLHNAETLKERHELGHMLKQADAQWREVSDAGMEVRSAIAKLRVAIGNAEYDASCAQRSKELAFQHDLALLRKDHHDGLMPNSMTQIGMGGVVTHRCASATPAPASASAPSLPQQRPASALDKLRAPVLQTLPAQPYGGIRAEKKRRQQGLVVGDKVVNSRRKSSDTFSSREKSQTLNQHHPLRDLSPIPLDATTNASTLSPQSLLQGNIPIKHHEVPDAKLLPPRPAGRSPSSTSMDATTEGQIALLRNRRVELQERIKKENAHCQSLQTAVDRESVASEAILQEYKLWLACLSDFAFRAEDVRTCYLQDDRIKTKLSSFLPSEEDKRPRGPEVLHMGWKQLCREFRDQLLPEAKTKFTATAPLDRRQICFCWAEYDAMVQESILNAHNYSLMQANAKLVAGSDAHNSKDVSALTPSSSRRLKPTNSMSRLKDLRSHSPKNPLSADAAMTTPTPSSVSSTGLVTPSHKSTKLVLPGSTAAPIGGDGSRGTSEIMHEFASKVPSHKINKANIAAQLEKRNQLQKAVANWGPTV